MEIKQIKTERVLCETQIKLADYVINPYRGCGVGCLYCYGQENKNAKDNHNAVGIKINALEILEKELRYKNPKRVLLGSTTECFQYAETDNDIIGPILSLLNKTSVPYTILTKSANIKKYINAISKNSANKIYFTLNFSDDEIIKTFEKKSHKINERLEAINALIKNGIQLRIHIGPFIPFISKLNDIFKLIPKGVSEVDVELYHKDMGNFSAILDATRKKFGIILTKQLNDVYANHVNYILFAQNLKNELLELKSKCNFSLFYLVPHYSAFYTEPFNYNESL